MSAHTPGPWALQLAEECTGRKLDELVQWVVTANDHDLWISTGPTWDAEHSEESLANARLIAAAPELLGALHEGRRAIGDHFAPNDCYATGPMTGDEFRDLVQCPACSFIAMYDAAISKAKGEQP